MSTFEYVMVLVSIVVGLAITHLLSAVGSTVHRLRGHGNPIRLDAVFILWVGYVLTWLVSFWWWEFKFQGNQNQWSFGLYLFIITYAICLFLLTVILIPSKMEDVHESYEYFMAGRKWFFGACLLLTGLDIGDTSLKGHEWLMRPEFLVMTGIFGACCIVGIVSERRRVQLAVAAIAFVVQQVYMFLEVGFL